MLELLTDETRMPDTDCPPEVSCSPLACGPNCCNPDTCDPNTPGTW